MGCNTSAFNHVTKNHLTVETHTMQTNSTVPPTIYLAGDHVCGLSYVYKP
jgi:hypothetical protein